MFMRMWVFQGLRQGIVKHKDRSLEAEAVSLEISLILWLIPRPMQAQSPFIMLRDCSCRNCTRQYMIGLLVAG